MGGLFGGSKPNSTTPAAYTQMQIQTSTEGMALPVVWGTNRVAPNLIYIANFNRTAGDGGKKGGGKGGGKSKSGSTNYNYTADIIMAVCEGPVSFINNVFYNSTVVNLAYLGLTFYSGSTTQTPWPDYYPGLVSIAYRNVCYVAANNYALGASPTVPQHAMEVVGFLAGSGSPYLPDANPADIIADFWTNNRYGLGMPGSYLADSTQYRTYCTATNILLSPCLQNSEQAISILQRWAQLTNSWIFWSENQIKFVPLGDFPITANGVTYTPVTTIQYDLTYDDFVADKNTPPITITRSDPSDSYNWVKVDISDRLNQYSTAVIEYKDETSINKIGLLQANEIQATEVCDRGIGAVIAGLIGNRAVYIRNTYAFKTSYNFVLLEPGDIVTVTDAAIGLIRYPVRIRSVDEDDKGNLSFVAEECPSGTGYAAITGSQPSLTLSMPALSIDPGSVNPPAILEPPASVTNGVAQVWIGLSGASQYWGGAQAYISVDDVTYIPLGSVSSPTPQGTLLAALSAHADPDTVNTLKIDFTESRQTISSAVTHADADALRTVVMVNNEAMGFGTVMPDGTNSFSYDLTYLRRGAYNTTIAAAAIGDQATVLTPGTVLKASLPQAYVGQTIYLKFTSFNIYGAAGQDISTVTRYSYVPTGVAYTIAPPTGIALAASSVTQADGTTILSMTASWTASIGPALGSYEVQFSADGGTTWGSDQSVGSAALSAALKPAVASTNYQARVRALSSNGLAVSGWDTSTTVNSGTLVAAVPAAPSGLVATAVPGGFTLSWAVSSDPSILSYQAWVAAGSGQPFSGATRVATQSAPATTMTVTGEAASPLSVFLVAVNAAGSSSPAG